MFDFKVEKEGAVGVLTLEGDQTIQYSNELRTFLLKSFDSVHHVVLDVERVTSLDLSCLQLICSAHKTAAGMKKRLTVTGNSETFKKAMEDGGYGHIKEDILNLPGAI